ncbi:hypothetical protein BC937DRAFT_92547, partial [Endogone sp. FLAS-F59071]
LFRSRSLLTAPPFLDFFLEKPIIQEKYPKNTLRNLLPHLPLSMDANAYNYFNLWGELPPPPPPSVQAASRPQVNNNTRSSQVILSGVPPGATATSLVDTLRMSYGVEHVTVSVRNDCTAVVNGLTLEASTLLIELGTIFFGNYMLKVQELPQNPSHPHPYPQQSWPGGFVRPVYERNPSYTAGSPGFPAGFVHPEVAAQAYGGYSAAETAQVYGGGRGGGGRGGGVAQEYGGERYPPAGVTQTYGGYSAAEMAQAYGGGGGGGGGGEYGANTRLESQFLSPIQYDQQPFFQDTRSSSPGLNPSPQSDWKVSRRRSTTNLTTPPPIRPTTPTPTTGPTSFIDPIMPINPTVPVDRPPSRNDFIQEYQSLIDLHSENEAITVITYPVPI